MNKREWYSLKIVETSNPKCWPVGQYIFWFVPSEDGEETSFAGPGYRACKDLFCAARFTYKIAKEAKKELEKSGKFGFTKIKLTIVQVSVNETDMSKYKSKGEES